MPQDRKLTFWFNLIYHGNLALLTRELELNPSLIDAVNGNEARLHEDLPKELVDMVGGSTKGMNALHTALVALLDTDVAFGVSRAQIEFFVNKMTVEQLNAQWANGNTALHLAAVLHNADAVKLLLERGADATIPNKFGVLPVSMVHGDDETLAAFAADPSVSPAAAAGTKRAAEEAAAATPVDSAKRANAAPAASSAPAVVKLTGAVINYDAERASTTPNGAHYDPYSDPSMYTVAPVTLDTAAAAAGQTPVARRKAKGQNFRKSLMMKAGDFKAALLTNELPSSVNRVMIVRVVDIKGLSIKGAKDGQQLLFTLELAPCKRYSRTFTIGQQVTTLNEEFQFPLPEGTSSQSVVFELYRRKTSWTDKLKKMIGTPAKGSEDADANADGSSGRTGESRDEVVANLCPRPMPDLLAKASNAIHRDDFVLFASSPARPVRGIVTMEFYIHTNPGASKAPSTMEDCAMLMKEREADMERVWIDGNITISDDMMKWSPRRAVLKGGEMLLFDDLYPTEPRGVKSLAGLKEITYMNREECDIPNSFKVTTDATFFYMFTETEAQMEAWMEAILQMMAKLEGPRASRPQGSANENVPPTPVMFSPAKSVRSPNVFSPTGRPLSAVPSRLRPHHHNN